MNEISWHCETTLAGILNIRHYRIIRYGSLFYITFSVPVIARVSHSDNDHLVDEYGYYSSGESFSFADPNEVGIMEMIEKGSI
jgi:hypothetical protein